MSAATVTRNRTGEGTPSRYITIEEICTELKISRSTFYEWKTKRKAPEGFRLPNGERRIRRIDYEAWLTSLEEKDEALA